MGYNYSDTPLGIYHQADDKVWQDTGQLMDAVFSTKPGESLV